MKKRTGLLLTLMATALLLSGCKGTDNTVRIEVAGPGVVTTESLTCEDECVVKLPLSWLESQLLVRKSVTLVAEPKPSAELFGWTSPYYYYAQDKTAPTYTVSVQAQCLDALDFRGSLVPCRTLGADHNGATAIFVEAGSIALSAWHFGSNVCVATTQDEIRCWGSTELETNIPDVINPSALKISRTIGCVKDDAGLKCWGPPYYLGETQPVLTDPTEFAVSNHFVCAIDQGQLVCWGRSANQLAHAPTLSNPTRITNISDSDNLCVIDDNGLHCWGSWANPAQSAPLGNETSITLPRYQCSITEDDFTCRYR